MELGKRKEPEEMVEENDTNANDYAEHYAEISSDRSEQEIPVMVVAVTCFQKQVHTTSLTYESGLYSVELHKKVKFPGWIVVLDALTGNVIAGHQTEETGKE